MPKIYTEIYTSYIPNEDITIVWQCMYQTDGKTIECIQRALVGWYCGEPDDRVTPDYANMPLIGQYLFD